MIRIQPFRADFTRHDDSCTIELSGEIDDSARRGLGPIVGVIMDSFDSVTVDLTRVDFVDSAGVELCLDAQGTSASSGTRLDLVEGRASVMAPFDILGVRPRFTWREAGASVGE